MIDKIVSHTDCFGCGVCSNTCPKQAIKMIENNNGFLVPSVDYSACVGCSVCKKNCPAINKYKGTPRLPIVFSARIMEEKELMESTSGGFFTAISDYVILNNGFVCGAVFEGSTVNHIISNSFEARNRKRGAKYVQSYIGDCFKEIKKRINQGQLVLFTGTSCQVHALLLLVGVPKPKNLITIDIICHGVSSQKYFDIYWEYIEKKYGPIERFRFRSKSLGWHGNNVEVLLKNGRTLKNKTVTKKYTDLFGKGLLMRDCCFNCPYATVFRIGDFSIGDFWGIEKIDKMYNDNKGCSIVFVNTKDSYFLFKQISSALSFKERDLKDSLQHNLIKPTEKPADICGFRKEIIEKGWKYFR